MAVDRNRLEQEAMRFLQKGQTDKAIAHYEKLLRVDPRDRRIRQKLAELYLQVGRVAEAERFFREIAQHLVKVRQERAAIAVVKQLAKLRPDDAEVFDLLGDCYRASNFPSDARMAYEQAIDMTARVRPDLAVATLEKLIKLAPGEQPLKVRMAELLEGAKWDERAVDAWEALAQDAVRLGRPDDRARFLEQALRLRKRTRLYLAAAEARLALRDAKAALVHLQAAYQRDPSEPRTLALLGQALEDLGQPHKARPIWMRAVALLEQSEDAEARAQALRRAIACGAKGGDLEEQLAEADRQVAARQLRLQDRPWAQAQDDGLAGTLLRAAVQWRYGFPDRAMATIEGLPKDQRASLPARVLAAEVHAATGDVAGAMAELQQVRPPDEAAAEELRTRLAVLGQGGIPEPASEEDLDEDDELLDDELLDDDLDGELEGGPGDTDDDELDDEADAWSDESSADDDLEDPGGEESYDDADEPLDDELTDPPTDAGDEFGPEPDEIEAQELTEDGQVEAAIAAWRRVLRRDPQHDVALMRIAELMAGTWGSPREPEPEPDMETLMRDGGTFAEIDPEDDAFDFGFSDEDEGEDGGGLGGFGDLDLGAPAEPAPAGRPAASGGLLDGLALQALGRHEEARAAFAQLKGLRALTLEARSAADAGDVVGGLKRLSFGLQEHPESDPSYTEALETLVFLSLRASRSRAAGRYLDELRDLDVDPERLRLVERALELSASRGGTER